MSDTTTTNGVVATLPYTCWVAKDAKGIPVDLGERVFHHPTQADAGARIVSDYDDDAGRTLPTPGLLPGPCFVATTVCGYVFDEGGEGVEHHATVAALAEHLADAEFTVGPDGRWRCPYPQRCDCGKDVPA